MSAEQTTEKAQTWECPDCPWVERAHPIYGWAEHNARAVEVHKTMLCPAVRTPPTKDPA